MSEDTNTSVDLSGEAKKILDMVKTLSVMDLANLVKAMEEEFGVSAAAPMAVAAAPAAAGGGADEAAGAEVSAEVNLELTAAGGQKIAVIKVVRELTGLGLKEAKDLVDAAPKVLKEKVDREQAEQWKKKLEEAGATVTLK